jgi:hypothetical protein
MMTTNKSPRTDTVPFTMAVAKYETIVLVRDFVQQKVRPVVERSAKEEGHDGTVYWLLLRTLGWLGTLGELKEPQHFQAAMGGTRALLEVAIDLALLHHDRANQTTARVAAWERSAKLHAAEKIQERFQGRALPKEHNVKIAFIARDGAAIRAERGVAWPGRKKPASHPGRWTGRSLEHDAAAADSYGGFGFADYYAGRFSELCWSTHGSGLAGIRFIPEHDFPGLIAVAFDDSARWAKLGAELALRYYDKFDAIAEARFRQLGREVDQLKAVTVTRLRASR